MDSSGSGAVLVSRCPRCSKTWKLPEPHGGICTTCFIEVVDSFEDVAPADPASTPEANAASADEDPKVPSQTGTDVEEGGEHVQSQLFQARVTRDIIVRSMVNGSTACTVRVSDDTCCSEVKKMIAENAHMPLDELRIFVGSRELLDEDVLGNATTYVEAIQVLRIDPRIGAAEKLAAELDVEGTSVDRRRKILEELSELGDGAGFQAEKIAAQLQFKPERPGIQHFPVRIAALVALGAVGSAAAMPHVPEIEACIERDPNTTRRLTPICFVACQTLAKLGCATPAHAEKIVQMMEGPDKVAACKCLMALGPELAAPHVGVVAANLQYPDAKEMTSVALDALRQLGLEVSRPYIDDIVKLLLPHAVHCSHAVEVLNDFGCVAEIAVTLHSLFPGARLRACQILADHGSEIAAPYATTFVALLRDEFLPVRIAAFKALGSLGPLIQDQHLGTVVAYFVDEDPNIREAACGALVQLGAAEVLAQYLQHDDPAICRRACLALGCLGPAAVPYMPAIQKLCCHTGEILVPGIGKVTLSSVAHDVLDQLQT